MKNVLVIGATGFVGGHLADGLAGAGHRVRCLVRTPAKAAALARHEVVAGDIMNAADVTRAAAGMDAVYVSIHTLSRQATTGGFMELERQGLANVVADGRAGGPRRLVYVTSLGVNADSTGYARERWTSEQLVLDSGLDATIVQPGQIVGLGGQGFELLLAAAKRRVAFVLGPRAKRLRTIGIDDLVDAMVSVLDEPRTFGLRLELGSDDVLTKDEMIDRAAEVLGRPHPWKVHVPLGLLAAAAPVIQRLAKLPAGAMAGLVDALDMDLVGDVTVSRAILPRVPVGYSESVRRALR